MTDDGGMAWAQDRRVPGLRCRLGALRPARERATAPHHDAPGVRAMLEFELARSRGDSIVVEVRGELDLQTADMLRARLLGLQAVGYRVLVVDLAGVPFCDAAGLGALVAAHNRAVGAGGEIRLSRVRPPQRKLLRVTGLHRVFALYDDPNEALAGGAAHTASQPG